MPLTQIVYDQSYFVGGEDIGGYSDYSSPMTYYNERPDAVAQKYIDFANSLGTNIVGKKVLVVGCAYGYSIQSLLARGVDAYGIDISSWAISQSPVAARIVQGNASLAAPWAAAKTLAGMTKPNDKFEVVIDEDMICCLTDAEATAFCAFAKDYGAMAFHLVDASPNLDNWYNFRTPAQWKAFIGNSPKEKWVSRFDWVNA